MAVLFTVLVHVIFRYSRPQLLPAGRPVEAGRMRACDDIPTFTEYVEVHADTSDTVGYLS